MRIHVLASGSTGNAVLFRLGEQLLLIDAGISARRIEHSMAALGYRAGDLDAILVTHEHKDHVSGLRVLARRYCIPVYTRAKTWQTLDCRDQLPPECIRVIDGVIDVGAVRVEAFPLSHDAVDPVGFCLHHKNKKVVLATDLGTITAEVENALAGAHALVLESNHDPDMLANGSYPHFLKQRIKSPYGHLSNQQAALLLSRMPRPQMIQVFLAHLSQENNTPQLARETVSRILANKGCQVGRDIILYPTHPHLVNSAALL
ncbi:MAG TPA: MBL fold metallo-hydrolase [Syntrophomonadaceae bacterium]|nr:MBL fold metallo-hydrolase [Syntrophomonadaceae bacterium]